MGRPNEQLPYCVAMLLYMKLSVLKELVDGNQKLSLLFSVSRGVGVGAKCHAKKRKYLLKYIRMRRQQQKDIDVSNTS